MSCSTSASLAPLPQNACALPLRRGNLQSSSLVNAGSPCHQVGLDGLAIGDAENSGDGNGVELLPRAVPQLVQRVPPWKGTAIRPVRDHCPVGVADRDDPAGQRDLLAAEAVRVATAVVALVVVADDPRDLVAVRQVAE